MSELVNKWLKEGHASAVHSRNHGLGDRFLLGGNNMAIIGPSYEQHVRCSYYMSVMDTHATTVTFLWPFRYIERWMNINMHDSTEVSARKHDKQKETLCDICSICSMAISSNRVIRMLKTCPRAVNVNVFFRT
jgi:hypothetical protein